ncbi:hypothetical protein P7K49_038408 [Saguinus oedipus]|uniref:Uncharacterized protein n=1 Tax=Saguinus oedipus TaxID=9490 RepID=A0ABQ9TEJ2_SAGOE|nr:hypothetical protein P7K49_038408 [Saguinus oedipus]
MGSAGQGPPKSPRKSLVHNNQPLLDPSVCRADCAQLQTHPKEEEPENSAGKCSEPWDQERSIHRGKVHTMAAKVTNEPSPLSTRRMRKAGPCKATIFLRLCPE